MVKKMKAQVQEIPWNRYEITLKDGTYYYYILENGTRRFLMSYSKDLSKEE